METPHTILEIALPTPLRRCFDYLAPSEIETPYIPGSRVIVPFGKRKMQGILVTTRDKSSVHPDRLRPIIEALDQEAVITPEVFKLCLFASRYYQQSLGELLTYALPLALRKGKKLEPQTISLTHPTYNHDTSGKTLTDEQTHAVHVVCENTNHFECFLLEGITGSGKTEVYFEVVLEQLKKDLQTLILVPEIGLTPQLVSRLEQRFRLPIAVAHSGMRENERLLTWQKAKSGEAKIIVGTRSAVFLPLKNPGLFIIDEEHDPSFKQQEGLRFSARDLAIIRAKFLNRPVILGSATPSLETLYNVKKNRYQILRLTKRPNKTAETQYHLVDIRGEKLRQGLSTPLIQAMQTHLARGEQILLFLNRRGYAPVLMCHHCGWIAGCIRCDARLVWHQSDQKLHCHHCQSQQKNPEHCPNCKKNELIYLGQGTERIEQTLQKLFPQEKIARLDRDTVKKKGALETLLSSIHNLEARILLGTQMLAKGHHFPEVTLAVILNADNYLYSPDFRASERMAQLILQVSGRAGRSDKPGTVWIQTHHPEHPLLQTLLSEGYNALAQKLLEERKKIALPPYHYLALMKAETKNITMGLNFLTQVKNNVPNRFLEQLKVLGPIPATQEKKQGLHRSHLLFQASNRSVLQSSLQAILDQIENQNLGRSIRWTIDVDPLETA